ncbi:hypothetical protein LOD99_16195 [Oopsacas minuta]|uniref:Guanine nucleotide-binding protein-like 1 n=1 Tax=Oopsacas minuta TaxID=111878 RepID=A0AAV7K6U1_9METZ|nr:hypothetical protein LOD99_16195 [Oopsacas minuta]
MHRKEPFSNKKKKHQLQQKRHKKQTKNDKQTEVIRPTMIFTPDNLSEVDPASDNPSTPLDPENGDDNFFADSEDELQATNHKSLLFSTNGVHKQTQGPDTDLQFATLKLKPYSLTKFHTQPGLKESVNNRFQLHFVKETEEEIIARKELATKPITFVPEKQLEISVDAIYPPGTILDIPKRPSWSTNGTRVTVEAAEEKMFEAYLEEIYSKFPMDYLSYFEHNLESWRELWRVLEISQVVMLITDVRHPALHFSPSLYSHVVKDLNKFLVLVLNKSDLVPASVAIAWKHYFTKNFPGTHVICFSAYPDDKASLEPQKKIKLRFPRHRRRLLSEAVGVEELFQSVKEIYSGKRDLSDLKKPDNAGYQDSISSESSGDETTTKPSEQIKKQTKQPASRPPRANILTIGMIGHPNVGKSSIINGLMGRKVVSASKTPGHTKHFQTIFITNTVCLCDCPGLVFPSLVPKQVQILSGMYPISQLREPYTPVGYLFARYPAIIDLLRLEHPRDSPCKEGAAKQEVEWTPLDLCEAWALKRGFYTAKAARPDIYRAANHLLRLATDGRICLYFRPPGYTEQQEQWAEHPETVSLLKMQRRSLQELERKRMMDNHAPVLDDIAIAEMMIANSKPFNNRKKKPPREPGENKFAILMNDSENDDSS